MRQNLTVIVARHLLGGDEDDRHERDEKAREHGSLVGLIGWVGGAGGKIRTTLICGCD